MEQDEGRSPPYGVWGTILVAALLLTAINAAKPVHIDDGAYLIFAEEFGKHPLDPYDFAFLSPQPGSANNILMPPLVPYWMALGSQCVGSDVPALKCWMFPFAVLFAWAVDFLAARFSPSLRHPVFWLCVFSPNIVPGFSLMLDLPVFALGFTALALTMLSLERDSIRLALAAAVVAGLTMQTKYNGAVSCAAILLWCLLKRRPWRGVCICAGAAAIFIGWEAYVASRQGTSHFLTSLKLSTEDSRQRMRNLIVPTATMVAGLGVAPAILAWQAAGRRAPIARGTAAATVVGLIAGLIALAFVSSQTLSAGIKIELAYYGLLAVPVWGAIAFAGVGLLRRGNEAAGEDRLYDRFIPAWFLLELAGSFALSPFPAARRVAGVVAVLTFGAGRFAHLRQVAPGAAWRCAGLNAALTVLYCYVVHLDAQVVKTTFDRVAAEVATLEQSARERGEAVRKFGSDRTAFTGATYYFHRAGWELLPARDQYRPERGDLLAVVDVEAFYIDGLKDRPNLQVERVAAFDVGHDFPLTLTIDYYAGWFPIVHGGDGRVKVQIFRVLGEKPPES